MSGSVYFKKKNYKQTGNLTQKNANILPKYSF